MHMKQKIEYRRQKIREWKSSGEYCYSVQRHGTWESSREYYYFTQWHRVWRDNGEYCCPTYHREQLGTVNNHTGDEPLEILRNIEKYHLCI